MCGWCTQLRVYSFMNSSAETFAFGLAHFSSLRKREGWQYWAFLSWQICPSLLSTAAIYNIAVPCVLCYYDNQQYNLGMNLQPKKPHKNDDLPAQLQRHELIFVGICVDLWRQSFVPSTLITLMCPHLRLIVPLPTHVC